MARRVYVPEELAPEARDLLLAFIEWSGNQETMMGNDQWTFPMMVDAFLLEASGVLEEVERRVT